MDKIEKTYGKGSIMKMGDEKWKKYRYLLRFYCPECGLGVGGYPRGRVIEIYGPESSGKTTSPPCIAEAQKAGGVAAFIDAEHAFDRFYAEKTGCKYR
jgi:recombination protein RecA